MSYKIAGIDVHKKMLAVVVSDVEVDGEYLFERRMFGSNPEQLRSLAAWLLEQEAEEVVMESTAQYWRPVWEALERYWKPLRQKREGARRKSGTLHLAQAQSNRGPRGRKKDFRDAERLVKRLVARELTLSFVPDAQQRLWRTVTRRKYQLTRDHVRLQNQLESLLEEAHIKLSSLVSDLLGVSARRMLQALADGETNATALAALADERLRATPEQLCDALGACTDLKPVYRRLLKMVLEQLQFLEKQISQLDQEMASLLNQHQDAVERLVEVPGLGVHSAQQIIAEVGPTAATFPSAKCLSSWVGACPGDDESAGVNYSHRSPKGNRHMRRLLNQTANAAAKAKGSIFEIVYRRSVPRLGHNQTIGAIGAYAHVGERIFTLIDARTWWAIGNFREGELSHIKPGMRADVYVLSRPTVRFSGVVDSLGFGVTPDPDLIGTLQPGLPDVQRTLNWVHLASRYPVRVRVENPPPDLFRVGESAVITIRGN